MKEDNANKNWKKDFPIQKQEAIHVSRRDFAKFLVLVSGGLMAGSGLIAIKTLFFPKQPIQGEHFICNAEDIPLGGTKPFVLKESAIPYFLIRMEDGSFKAYEQKCTHLSCMVYYKPGSGQIVCPCHKGLFDAHTGAVLKGPPPRSLPRLDVVMKGKAVFVKSPEQAG